MRSFGRSKRKPIGLQWRASSWFVTFVIALSIATDLLVYSIIIPVLPFQLEKLGYSNVSALTGWLLFSYSAGLVIATIPIAMFSERYNMRQAPLIIGLVVLVGSQIMLMEAPNYPVMCISRILQGAGSSMVWVVGLALLCDSAPHSLVGRQLGLAMSGVSIGVTIGPPVGGALYSHFGFRGPFIFSIATTVFDLVGRLLIIERKNAFEWGYDPAAEAKKTETSDTEKAPSDGHASAEVMDGEPPRSGVAEVAEVEQKKEAAPPSSAEADAIAPQPRLSFLAVISKLLKTSRALTALFIIFAYGVLYAGQEPAIPLHLQSVWGLDSKGVGLVFIASVIPTFFSSALVGFWVDRSGTEWPSAVCMFLSLPWWIVVILEYKLALFIVGFALTAFFTSAVLAPMTADLAVVSRELEGVGYAHVYGAFNFVYGIGSAVGPVVGGQLYAHVSKGWMALCLLCAGLVVVCLVLSFCFIGNDPLYHGLLRRVRGRNT